MEKNMKKNILYNLTTLLYTRNQHNIVSQLYLNKKERPSRGNDTPEGVISKMRPKE